LDRNRFLFVAGGVLFMRNLPVVHGSSGRTLPPWSLFALAALLCPLVLPLPAGAADFKTSAPAVIVRVHSLNGLLGDIKHLAGEFGHGELLKPLEGFLEAPGGKGPDGIDRGKPFGFYVTGAGGDSTLVALAPVADEKAFLEWLNHLGVKTEKGKGGLYTGELPGAPFGLSFRFSDGYVCATLGDEDALNKDVLLSPAQVFPSGQARLVAAEVRLDQMSDHLKRLLVLQFRQAFRLGETEGQQDSRKQMLEDAGALLETVLRDGRQLQVSLDFERRGGDLVAELSLDGKPKSTLAEALAALGRSRSLFGGVSAEGAALHALVNLTLPENARKALAVVIDEHTDQVPPWAAGVLKALAPSLKSGELDAVVSLQPPAPDTGKPHTLLAGVKLKDGPAVDRAVRDLVKELPSADRDRVRLDAEKVNEIPVHRVEVQKELGAAGKKAFGDGPANVAIRGDAAFLTLGANSLPALKEAMTVAPQAGPQVFFEVHLARLAPAIALDRGDEKGVVAKAAAEAFPGGARDRLRFSLEGGPALKVRFDINAAVLKFVGLLEKAEAEGK
jgi:hypothetical protein